MKGIDRDTILHYNIVNTYLAKQDSKVEVII